MQTIVVRKGYSISSAKSDEGLIRAHSKKKLFRKAKTLDMKICKIDQHSTVVNLMLNSNALFVDRPVTEIEREEARLNDSINRYF